MLRGVAAACTTGTSTSQITCTRRTTRGNKLGVLTDWDLATYADRRHNVLERTGTIPFMAIDLLPESVVSAAEHLYRYGLETLFWVLVWVCYPAGTFAAWFGTCDQCRKKKHDFLGAGTCIKIRADWVGLDIVLIVLTSWLKSINDDRKMQRDMAQTLLG